MRDFFARLKNIITLSAFEKRLDSGNIRVQTAFSRVIEKPELFQYGIYGKAKKGKVIVLCAGGNFDAAEILPVLSSENAPELKAGDFCIYSAGGSSVICRDDGTVEVNGNQNGGVVKVEELQNQLEKATARIDGIMNALKNSPTTVQDGGAAYKAAIALALAALSDKERYDDLASEAVFHGTG